MQAVETAAELPAGAGPISDYSRNYARQPDGKIIAVFVTPHDTDKEGGCEIMLANGDARPCTEAELAEGKAFDEALSNARGEAGQSRWYDDRIDLPAMNGGGCAMVTIIYDPATKRVESAECNGDY